MDFNIRVWKQKSISQLKYIDEIRNKFTKESGNIEL